MLLYPFKRNKLGRKAEDEASNQKVKGKGEEREVSGWVKEKELEGGERGSPREEGVNIEWQRIGFHPLGMEPGFSLFCVGWKEVFYRFDWLKGLSHEIRFG